MPVVVDNDANVAALGRAHARCRARASTTSCSSRSAPASVAAIVSDGAVLRGAHGFGAEIGHFQVDPDGPLCACGERGHWEALGVGHRARCARARARARAGGAPSVLAARGRRRRRDHGRARRRRRAGGRRRRARDRRTSTREQVAVGLVGLVNILDPGARGDLGRAGRARRRAARPGPRVVRRAHRGRRATGPRCRSCRPRSATTPGWSAPRCSRARPCDARDEARDHAAVVPRRPGAGARGRGRGRGRRPRRRVRLRPPLPPRARTAPDARRSRCSRCMGAVAAETQRIAIGSLVARVPRCARPRCSRTASTPWRASSARTGCSSRSAPATARARRRTRASGSTSAPWPTRVDALRDAVDGTARPRLPGVGRRHATRRCASAGGRARRRVELVGRRLERFRDAGRDLRVGGARARRSRISWGGLVVLGADDDAARGEGGAARRRARRDRRRARAGRRRAARRTSTPAPSWVDDRAGRLVGPGERAHPRRGGPPAAPRRVVAAERQVDSLPSARRRSPGEDARRALRLSAVTVPSTDSVPCIVHATVPCTRRPRHVELDVGTPIGVGLR